MALNTFYKQGSAVAVVATGFCQLGTEDMLVPIGVYIGGTFVGTVIVEVSNDTEAAVPTWVPFSAAVTAPGTVKIDIPVKGVRLRCSAYTSGTIVGSIAGVMGTT